MKCGHSCCWTPHGVCAKKGRCACHFSADNWDLIQEMLRTGLSEDEINRRRRLRGLRELNYRKSDGERWAR